MGAKMGRGQLNEELLAIVEDYLKGTPNPARVRSGWIAKDLVDRFGFYQMDVLRTTTTLKSSVEVCLRHLGYVDGGVAGAKLWVLSAPAAREYRQVGVLG